MIHINILDSAVYDVCIELYIYRCVYANERIYYRDRHTAPRSRGDDRTTPFN